MVWMIGERGLPIRGFDLLVVRVFRLSLPKILSGANAFEINNIQEHENEASLARRLQCSNVTLP
jgi:hypothetical protein